MAMQLKYGFPDLSKVTPKQALAWYLAETTKVDTYKYGSVERVDRKAALENWKRRIFNPWLLEKAREKC